MGQLGHAQLGNGENLVGAVIVNGSFGPSNQK